jgi:glutamyl-tRNA reductase
VKKKVPPRKRAEKVEETADAISVDVDDVEDVGPDEVMARRRAAAAKRKPVEGGDVAE